MYSTVHTHLALKWCSLTPLTGNWATLLQDLLQTEHVLRQSTYLFLYWWAQQEKVKGCVKSATVLPLSFKSLSLFSLKVACTKPKRSGDTQQNFTIQLTTNKGPGSVPSDNNCFSCLLPIPISSPWKWTISLDYQGHVVCCVWGEALPLSPAWPQTRNIPTSASKVLGLHANPTPPGYNGHETTTTGGWLDGSVDDNYMGEWELTLARCPPTCVPWHVSTSQPHTK